MKWFCCSDYSVITKPTLVGKEIKQGIEIPMEHNRLIPNKTNNEPIYKTVSSNNYKIISKNGSASILTSTFQRLGLTPLELDKKIYR